MKFSKKLAFIFCLNFLLQCSNTGKDNIQPSVLKETPKINGVSFVAPPKKIGENEIIQPQKRINANYLSIMPYGYIGENSNDLVFDNDWQWWGEKTEGVIQTIKTAKNLGYKIMLKPHVWKRHGLFTGDHDYEKEEEWKNFEIAFEKYILHHAEISDYLKVEIFCIGTEWGNFVEKRPIFWKRLINKVKKVYNGKITYAANWDEYSEIEFWEELDFIGVDAYFPLVKNVTPGIEELKKAFEPYKEKLKKLSDSTNKKILLAEYGYRSIDNTAEKPWESENEGSVNIQGQENAYSALYESFWDEEFVAGGFLWKWFTDYENVGGEKNNGFTPQNKSTENIIKARYSN